MLRPDTDVQQRGPRESEEVLDPVLPDGDVDALVAAEVAAAGGVAVAGHRDQVAVQEHRAAGVAEAGVAAANRDIRIAGGGATILQYLNAGLVDEFTIALSPVLFGSGIRLFEGLDAVHVALKPLRAEPTRRVTHLTYAVNER